MIFLSRSTTRQALLRLEHLFEENETNDELSEDVTVTLTEDFFSTFTIIKIQEFSLGGNILKSDMSRLKWRTNGGGDVNVSSKVDLIQIDPSGVLLYPDLESKYLYFQCYLSLF